MSYAQQTSHEFMTEDEYLASEPYSDVKREYIDGRIYAMAGAKNNHVRIAGNIYRKLGNHLEGTPCEAFIADTRIRLGKDYVYPDVFVDCSRASGDDYCAAAPKLIVEVLSASTRKTDTTTKLIRYINLATLQEYVMIEQDFVCVQVLRKNKHWQPEYFYLGDAVNLESIDLTLSVADIYDRVDLRELDEFRQAATQQDENG